MVRTAAPKFAACAALLALAACAGFEPSGRNASDSAAPALPPPQAEAPPQIVPPYTPPPQAAAPAATTTPPAGAAANLGPPPARPRPASGDEVIVPGVRERQITPPQGDARTASQRAADIRAWDDCVMRVQGRSDGDPLGPQLDSPEDVCRERLGMASRNAVPVSRDQ